MKLYLIIIALLFVSCKKEVESNEQPKSLTNTFTVVTNQIPFFIYQSDTTFAITFDLPVNDTAMIVVRNNSPLTDSTHIEVFKNNTPYSEHHSLGSSEIGGLIY